MMDSNPNLTCARRILVIDDDASLREALRAFFQQAGFEVHPAHDGPSGLAAFNAEHFDLICVDFRMPGMTGLEVAAAVRRVAPVIPIILITGDPYGLEPEALAGARISRVLVKPFTLDELRSCLDLMMVSMPTRYAA